MLAFFEELFVEFYLFEVFGFDFGELVLDLGLLLFVLRFILLQQQIQSFLLELLDPPTSHPTFFGDFLIGFFQLPEIAFHIMNKLPLIFSGFT